MTSGKRYSVFVSSTWEDLQAERAAVYQTILENSGIPIGMEHFPSGLPKVELIKSLIDQCDYLIVLSAANYGSIDEASKLGYTELEVRYAQSRSVPIIPFVSKLERLPSGQVEKIPHLKELRKLHQLLMHGLDITCNFFESADELRGQVASSLNSAYQRISRPGMIRGDSELRLPLEGVWELRVASGASGERRFKIYTDSSFVYVQYDENSGLVVKMHGGTYELVGERYSETCLFSGPRVWKTRGDTHNFRSSLSADSFRIARATLDETWHRSELANNMLSQSGE